jgi:hypothetical protein
VGRTEIIDKLKNDIGRPNSMKALRKIYSICKTLDACGYFDWSFLEPFDEKNSVFNNIEPPLIIKNLIDGGQLEPNPINGKYKPYKSMPNFIVWCFQHGYEDDISAEFIFKNIVFRGSSIRSIKIYINNAKDAK